MLTQVIYISSATYPFTDDDLKALLAVARRKNEPLGLTGLLLYANGTFMQLLEGPASAVDACMAKIGRDPRHTGINMLVRTEVEEREFAEWSMGFHRVGPEDCERLPGYAPVFETGFREDSLTRMSDGGLALLQALARDNAAHQ